MKACRNIIVNNFEPRLFQGDVRNRDPADMPTCDFFSTTFPCQPFSKAGKQRGQHDDRGCLVTESLKYIQAKLPKAVLLENVDAIMQKKYRPVLELIETTLHAEGYVISQKVLNSRDFGVPMNRRRWYLIGLHESCPGAWTFEWPEPPAHAIPVTMDDIVPVLGADEFEALPKATDKTKFDNVHAAYQTLSASGVNPFTQHCVIDIGCSERFRHFAVDHCPTLTKSRAGTFGYWDSKKGGVLTVHDMCKLMGFSSLHLKWQTLVTPNQLAGALGNGCSVTVLTKLLPKVLNAAGFISVPQRKLLEQRSEAYRLALKTNAPPVLYMPAK
jgi:DNA-cytosine methyltransferase